MCKEARTLGKSMAYLFILLAQALIPIKESVRLAKSRYLLETRVVPD